MFNIVVIALQYLALLQSSVKLLDCESPEFLSGIAIKFKKFILPFFRRNAYNDLYHWTARYSFLEKLITEGREMYNVVYIDPDILILKDLHSVFERDFDYLQTISENEEQPINGAMHFVPKGKYHEVSPWSPGKITTPADLLTPEQSLILELLPL